MQELTSDNPIATEAVTGAVALATVVSEDSIQTTGKDAAPAQPAVAPSVSVQETLPSEAAPSVQLRSAAQIEEVERGRSRRAFFRLKKRLKGATKAEKLQAVREEWAALRKSTEGRFGVSVRPPDEEEEARKRRGKEPRSWKDLEQTLLEHLERLDAGDEEPPPEDEDVTEPSHGPVAPSPAATPGVVTAPPPSAPKAVKVYPEGLTHEQVESQIQLATLIVTNAAERLQGSRYQLGIQERVTTVNGVEYHLKGTDQLIEAVACVLVKVLDQGFETVWGQLAGMIALTFGFQAVGHAKEIIVSWLFPPPTHKELLERIAQAGSIAELDRLQELAGRGHLVAEAGVAPAFTERRLVLEKAVAP